MSVEKVKAFFEKAAEDKGLQEKLQALAERQDALYMELVQIASEAGFEFSKQDAKVARLRERIELGDDELVAVTGGAVGMDCPNDAYCMKYMT